MSANGWPGVELRHLLTLEAILAEGTFRGAAESLGYTQSAVSQQVAALERAVGQRLIERPGGSRAISFTEAGTLVVGHARRVMDQLNAARSDIEAFGQGSLGSLRVGTFQSVGARVLPAVMERFTADWPAVELSLSERNGDSELLELLESGEADLAFSAGPVPAEQFGAVELLVDPYVLLVPASSELAGAGRVPKLGEIAALPLIGGRVCRSGAAVEQRIRDAGFEPQVVFRSDDNGTVAGMVAAGVGVAFVARLAFDPTDERTVGIELGDLVPPRVIVIAWRADRYLSPAAEAFIDVARAVCRALGSGSG